MRTWMRVWPCSLAVLALVANARAEGLPAEAAPLGEVNLSSLATRHGTSFETVYQLQLEPSATLRLDSLELSALLPLSTSATYPTFCCRLALGNATLAVVQRKLAAGWRHWYGASLSLPTSHWSDAHASSLAATAAVTRDAGYYLHDTTTLRGGLGAELDVAPWLTLAASAEADYWLRPEEPNPLIVPLTAAATWRWAHVWSARAAYRSLLRLLDPLGPGERALHELSGAVALAWASSRLELSVSVPLDASLRELGMISVGSTYVRSF